MTKKNLPRGIRNCNPLNIRRSPHNRWLGEVDYKETYKEFNGQQCETREYDRTFCQFSCMEQGYRAAAILLHRYIKNGYNTYEKIISRWAPPSENYTDVYINGVCNYCVTCPDHIVNFYAEDILPLMAAMTIMENGPQYDPFDKNDELLKDLQGGFMLAYKYV